MTEQVEYTVIKNIGKIEIRRYPKMVLATVSGHTDNGAFSLLFDYIQGNNRSRRKVPMTAPVISDSPYQERVPMKVPVVSTAGSFSFVLPSGYTGQDAPEPTDSRVTIQEIPEREVAVLAFRGATREAQITKKSTELLTLLNGNSISTVGKPFLMRYNPPIVPGLFRHNEIAVEVAPSE
jgi:hypothetical protein